MSEVLIPADRRQAASDLSAWQLFDFERALAPTLRRFPMAMRYKLDRCALHVNLEQWQMLSVAERQTLAAASVETKEDRAAFVAFVDSALQRRCGVPAQRIEPAPRAIAPVTLPESVKAQCRISGVAEIDAAQWQRLTALARFSLCKSSRPGHRNRDFDPLYAELFGARSAVGSPRKAKPDDRPVTVAKLRRVLREVLQST
jgi:hypothetical protein